MKVANKYKHNLQTHMNTHTHIHTIGVAVPPPIPAMIFQSNKNSHRASNVIENATPTQNPGIQAQFSRKRISGSQSSKRSSASRTILGIPLELTEDTNNNKSNNIKDNDFNENKARFVCIC